MQISTILAVYRKEMLDMIRDRRTMISMVLVPILAIPVMLWFAGLFISSAEKKAGEEAATVAIANADRLPGLLNALAGAKFNLVSKSDLKKAVEKKEVAAGVEPLVLPDGKTEVQIYADNTRQSSSIAAGKIRTALDSFKQNSVSLRLRELGIAESVYAPFTVKRVDVAPAGKMAGMVMGGILGYVVVLLMFSGGMYPAIDLTAGEKERRTLEVLLSAPASRDAIILGKVIATTTALYLTALLTMASMVTSLRIANFGNAAKLLGSMSLGGQTVALTLVALFPMAVLAASLMVGIALFAKSFKEAQSYLTPLVMVAIFPLFAGLQPGLQLTPTLAVIPLFNVCQLIKEIFQGEYSHVSFAITMISNFIYAAIAFYGAGRIFKDERVLFRT